MYHHWASMKLIDLILSAFILGSLTSVAGSSRRRFMPLGLKARS